MLLVKLTRALFFVTMLLFSTATALPVREPVDYYKIIIRLVADNGLNPSTQANQRYAIFDLACCIHRKIPLDARSIPILHNLGFIDHQGQPSKTIRERCNIVSLIE